MNMRKQVVQTLQWAQGAEEVEARSGQVAKREEDQAPGDAKQSADSQQGTCVTLGSVTLTLSILAGHSQSETTS